MSFKNPLPQFKASIDIFAGVTPLLEKASFQDWNWAEMVGEIIFRIADLAPYLFQCIQPQGLNQLPAKRFSLPLLTDTQFRVIRGIAYCVGGGLTVIGRRQKLMSHIKLISIFVRAQMFGSASAQLELKKMYAEGQEVSQSNEEAVKWITKSAEKEHAEAQYYLGVMYAEGRGISQSLEKAVFWFRKAAEKVHELAKQKIWS